MTSGAVGRVVWPKLVVLIGLKLVYEITDGNNPLLLLFRIISFSFSSSLVNFFFPVSFLRLFSFIRLECQKSWVRQQSQETDRAKKVIKTLRGPAPSPHKCHIRLVAADGGTVRVSVGNVQLATVR